MSDAEPNERADEGPSNFIRDIIREDVAAQRSSSAPGGGRVVTRFPPEPNGYLHLGHAKAICLDFGMAAEFGGHCNLRFDDTNPEAEDVEYVDSIKEDVRWLGFDWGEHEHFASDYYRQLYEWAIKLIEDGKAYVDSLSTEEIPRVSRELLQGGQGQPLPDPLGRGEPRAVRADEAPASSHDGSRGAAGEDRHGLAQPQPAGSTDLPHQEGQSSPHRRRVVHLPDVRLRARVVGCDRGGDPLLCTLEFEDHRPLYDWFIEQLPVPYVPRQIEFARLNVGYMIMSKRKLLRLVEEEKVSGWDDPPHADPQRAPAARGHPRGDSQLL